MKMLIKSSNNENAVQYRLSFHERCALYDFFDKKYGYAPDRIDRVVAQFPESVLGKIEEEFYPAVYARKHGHVDDAEATIARIKADAVDGNIYTLGDGFKYKCTPNGFVLMGFEYMWPTFNRLILSDPAVCHADKIANLDRVDRLVHSLDFVNVA